MNQTSDKDNKSIHHIQLMLKPIILLVHAGLKHLDVLEKTVTRNLIFFGRTGAQSGLWAMSLGGS